jgi:glutamyl-tRNA synthetase
MLAFLGWNPGTEQELFSLEELIQAFSLEKVSKSGAKFNLDKTKWFQQQYMQRADNKLLAENFNKIITKETQKTFDKEYIRQVVSLIKERAIFIDDLWSLGFYFFKAPLEYDIKATKKAWKEGTENIMHVLTTILEDIPDFNSNAIETVIKKWIEEKQLSFGKVLMPFRLSLVGSMQGPHVFDIAAMIGKEETISRINNAIKQLS